MEEKQKEKAIRIYETIKRNKNILNDKKRSLNEYQKSKLTRDNVILLEVLEVLEKISLDGNKSNTLKREKHLNAI